MTAPTHLGRVGALHIGRVGTLAAALGVGVALLTGPAVASADRGASDASTAESPTDATTGSSSPARAPKPARTAPSDHVAATAPTPKTGRVTGDASSATDVAPDAPRRGRGPAGTAVGPGAIHTESDTAEGSGTAAPDPNNDVPTVAAAVTVDEAITTSAAPSPAAALTAVALTAAPSAAAAPVESVAAVPSPVTSAVSNAGSPDILAVVADRISTAITSVVSRLAQTFSGSSPFAPPAESPATWALLAEARRQPAAAATGAATTAAATTSTGPTLLVLDGYNVVAASQKLVTSFYGPFVNFPAYPGIQSEQTFNLVDPATKQVVGSFKALQSEFTAVGTTRQLVVTDVLSGTAGTAAGQIPVVGTVISSSDNFGFGTLYTATPSASGNAVSFKIVTPFGSAPIPFPYDAAKGLTDFAKVNAPLILPGSGYSIAPAKPSTEVITSVTGLQPLFTAIQGIQDYTVYDKNGIAVGGFVGQVTTTSDALGLFTKEIRVTSVGTSTDAHVPSVGTVYNLFDVSDNLYALYSSTPSSTGTAISIQLVTPFGSTSIPFNLNASAPPELKSLQVPNGGYKFVPTSDSPIVGINGLPPREMITQGYQQFDVVDILGNKIGSVDADVTRQWDWMGGNSNAILITKVNSGTAGPLPWNVPPVGSVFNFRQQSGINLGFSDYYSSIPTVLGDIVTYGTVTPFGLIPLFLPNDLSAGLAGAAFVDPFAVTK